MVKRRIAVSKCSFYVVAILVLTVALTVGFMLFAGQKANAENSQYVPCKAIICVKESKQSILDNPVQPLSFFQNLDANDGIVNKESEALNYTVDEELMTLDNVKELKDTAKTDNKIMDLPNSFCLFQKLDNTSNTESCKLLRVNCDNTEDFVKKANCSKEILWAQPDYIMKSIGGLTAEDGAITDPGYAHQWGYQSAEISPFGINAPEYWEADTDGPNENNAVVAVVDTGVDYTHEDLEGQIYDGLDEIDALKNIGGGKYGFNTVVDDGVLDTTNPMDRHSHGTHCATAIAGKDNDKGVRGVNYKHTKIVPCRFLGENGGPTSDALKCYNYIITARQNGVNISVVSNSWGDSDPHTLPNFALDSVLNKAGENGIMSVFAAGNDSRDLDYYTSSHKKSKYVLTIGASDNYGQCASFSNFSKRIVDFFAPGVEMLSASTSFVPESSKGDNRTFFPFINPAEDVFVDLDFSKEAHADAESSPSFELCATQRAAAAPETTEESAEASADSAAKTAPVIDETIKVDADYSNNSASFDLSKFDPHAPILFNFSIPKSLCPDMFESGVFPYVYGSIESTGVESSIGYLPFVYIEKETGATDLIGDGSYSELLLQNKNEFSFKITDENFLNSSIDAFNFIGILRVNPDSDLSSAKFAFNTFTFGKKPSDYCLMSGTSMACPVAAAIASVVTGHEQPQNGDDVIKCMDIVKGTTSYSQALIDKAKIPSIGNIYSAYKYLKGDESVLHPVINDVKYEVVDDKHINFKLYGRFFNSVIDHEDLTKNIGFNIDNHRAAFPTEIQNWNDEYIEFTIDLVRTSVSRISCKNVGVELFYGVNKISSGYVELAPKDNDCYTTLNTPEFTYNETDPDITYSVADLNPIRMASTSTSAYCLMTQNTHDDAYSVHMIKYSYDDQSWTDIDMSELEMTTSFYDAEHEYDQCQFSLASGNDEIYLLYNKNFQDRDNFNLATYSEKENKWTNDISLSDVAQRGDMICNYNGVLLLCGKNLYIKDTEKHRNVDIVQIFPDVSNKFKEIGNLPNFDKSLSSEMRMDEDTPEFDDIAYGDMTVYGNDIYITNRICDTDKGEIDVPVRFNGSDITNESNWTETRCDWYTEFLYPKQANITASCATKNGFVEVGNVVDVPGIEPVDTFMYYSSEDIYNFYNRRMFPSKMGALAGVCHNNSLFALAKNYNENYLMFRAWDLASVEDESQNVEWNVAYYGLPATISPDSIDDNVKPNDVSNSDNKTTTDTAVLSDAKSSQTTETDAQTASESSADNNTTAQTGDVTYLLVIALLVSAAVSFILLRKNYRKDL